LRVFFPADAGVASSLASLASRAARRRFVFSCRAAASSLMIDRAASVVTFAFVSDPDRRGLKRPSGTTVFVIFHPFSGAQRKKAGRKPDLSATSTVLPVHPWSTTGDESDLCRPQVLCGALSSSAVGHDFEADFLAFVEPMHPGPLDSGDVDENILAPVIRLDETKTLAGVKELYDTGRHRDSLLTKE